MIAQRLHTLVETAQFYVDNLLYGVEVELIEGYYLVKSVKELWRELLGEAFLDNAAGIFLVFLVHCQTCSACVEAHSATKLFQLSCACVAGHYYHCVAEVYQTTVAISETTLVKHLQQHVEHIAVSLLYLVEQHDGVGLAAHLLRQLTTFLISHISWRRSHKTRGVETLGVFAHVNAYQCILRTEHLLCQFLCEIGLADTCRTEKHECPDGVVGFFHTNAVALYSLHHFLYCLVLCHYTCLQFVCHVAQSYSFALCHALHRHTRCH